MDTNETERIAVALEKINASLYGIEALLNILVDSAVQRDKASAEREPGTPGELVKAIADLRTTLAHIFVNPK